LPPELRWALRKRGVPDAALDGDDNAGAAAAAAASASKKGGSNRGGNGGCGGCGGDGFVYGGLLMALCVPKHNLRRRCLLRRLARPVRMVCGVAPAGPAVNHRESRWGTSGHKPRDWRRAGGSPVDL
jgi:hypothetical protein